MLDTDIASYIIKASSAILDERVARYDASELCISSVTRGELRYGVARSGSAKLAVEVESFLQTMLSLAWDELTADHYGTVRAELERAGTPIGHLDTMIAAHAIATDLTLISNNDRHFSMVHGLQTENWLT